MDLDTLAQRADVAGATKWLKFKVAPKVHTEMTDKVAELGKDPNEVVVKAIRHYHRHRKAQDRARAQASKKKKRPRR